MLLDPCYGIAGVNDAPGAEAMREFKKPNLAKIAPGYCSNCDIGLCDDDHSEIMYVIRKEPALEHFWNLGCEFKDPVLQRETWKIAIKVARSEVGGESPCYNEVVRWFRSQRNTEETVLELIGGGDAEL